MRCELFVRFEREGFHRWPAAPDHRAYLRARHRHIFHIEVRMPAAVNDDREVEYHDLLDDARRTWGSDRSDLGMMSCETLAAALARSLSLLYGRPTTVSVSEDGECGATVSVGEPAPAASEPRSATAAAPYLAAA